MRRIFPLNRAPHMTARVLSLAIVVIAIVATRAAAQHSLDTTGRWEVIDHMFHSGLPSDGVGEFWITVHSPRHVFLLELLQGSDVHFHSSDKGATWSPHEGLMPAVVKYFTGGVGISTRGEITYDDGVTWGQLTYDPGDTTFSGYLQPWDVSPGSPKNIVVKLPFAQIYFDSAQGRNSYITMERILYTTDGGSTWNKLDTVIDNGNASAHRRFELHLASRFDGFPVLPGESRPRLAWDGWYMMADSTTLFLRVNVESTATPSSSGSYLVRIDLVTGGSVWHRAPSGRIAAHTRDFLTTLSPSGSRVYLLRSLDGGATWDTVSTPASVNLFQLSVLSPTHMVGPYAKTFDGGSRWQPIGHSWDGTPPQSPRLALIDSANYLMTNSYSLVARSTDAGATWTRNHVWGTPRSMAASRDRVLIGWSYRALTLSTDRGETWSDIGVTGGDGLPGHVTSIAALGFPDTVATPDVVIGLAIFNGSDGVRYAGLIRSDDGGRTWQEGARLEAEDLLEPLFNMVRTTFYFVPMEGGGNAWIIGGRFAPMVSSDNGVTWSQRGTRTLDRLAMKDSEHGIGYSTDVDAILRTEDGWRTSSEVFPIDFGRWILGIDTLRGGVYRVLFNDGEIRSTDGGVTWSTSFTAANDLRASYVIIHRLDSSRFYLTTGDQFFYSADGGRTYQSFATGVATGHGNYTYHVAASDGHYIYVATGGNFIARWRLGDEPTTGVHTARENDSPIISLTTSPLEDVAVLRCEIAHTAPVEVSLCDLLGNRLVRGDVWMREVGVHTERLDLASLPSGRYFVRVRIGASIRSLPLLIAR